jgi:DNA replicative helicase MCM subunit Mcm2 (Cdc46/Mcm family)
MTTTAIPPPPPPPPQDADFAGMLSSVTLNDNNLTILLNGDFVYPVALPIDILTNRNPKYRFRTIANKIYEGCNEMYNLDYVSEQNVNNRTKEVMGTLYNREEDDDDDADNATAAAEAMFNEEGEGEEESPKEVPLSEVTYYNAGKYIIPKVKIVGVSPPYKLISSITIKCGKCGDEKIEDHTDMPLMSYKGPTRMRCAICKEASDVSDVFDHVEAQSITVQDGDMRDDLKRLHVVLIGNLTKNIRVGEIVTITGKMTVLNPQGLNNKKATAAMYAQNIRYDREEESPITEDDITLFRDFAAKHGTETPKELVKMFAPQVIGHDDAKLGILRSAVNIKEAEPITGFRTRTHTDLAGPPGTVKSKLAYESMSLVPNAEWVTSEHATIKSTLAIVDKDPDSGGLMLMLGPIPRAKNSLCGIDEIGTTLFEDQQHYASILEQGRFTKIAYGRDYDIDSPTTIICTTNPTGGYWDKGRKPSLDQIPLKSNIKDRIDQHYIFQDYETDEECRDYAMQKTQNYLNPESVKPDYDFLRRYLAYASSLPVPKLTPEAASMLSFFWQRMRREGFMSNRSFDSLHRIALAQTRLHLKSEVDTQVVKEVMQDLQLMYVKLGKLVDTSIEDPRTLAREEIIQYVNTIAFPIDFIDALKHVYEHNELVKQYLGPKVEWWNVRDNRKIRAIYDMFTDGGTGELKKASNGSTIAVHSLKPLTLVRVEVVGMSHASHPSPDVGNKLQEESNNEKNPSTGDLSDTSDTQSDLPLNDLTKKAMRDKDYFTRDDWVFTLQMLPNERRTEDESEQTLYQLLQEGKIRELEPGKYQTTTTTTEEGGGS